MNVASPVSMIHPLGNTDVFMEMLYESIWIPTWVGFIFWRPWLCAQNLMTTVVEIFDFEPKRLCSWCNWMKCQDDFLWSMEYIYHFMPVRLGGVHIFDWMRVLDEKKTSVGLILWLSWLNFLTVLQFLKHFTLNGNFWPAWWKNLGIFKVNTIHPLGNINMFSKYCAGKFLTGWWHLMKNTGSANIRGSHPLENLTDRTKCYDNPTIVHIWENQRIIKASMIPPLGIMNVCSRFHGKISNSCWE